ncbi:beta-ketoacyl-ACP synthase II [uncultured Thalassospira sp.]|jgi:3-oxoacyl-[acyl-carrier-protein] synthase II|uniref:beta-ketoacyl-ACP synthase II n=1 Tax=uncultured Thalassospira sp. TaxID=404382 RepID=UPI0030D9D9C4|tara:strand:+ start:16769 stop:18034 length:1266 start_codon:yes stop_codon:yes gene_type:complete
MMTQRIVVTGMGLVTPLGCGLDAVWQRLIAGQSGVVTHNRFDSSDLPTRFAGLVPDHTQHPAGLNEGEVISKKDRKKVDLFTIYALSAARQALAQAGWTDLDQDAKDRTATVIGTGIGGLPVITHAEEVLLDRGPSRISPFVVPSFLANMAAGNVSIQHGFRGPIGAPVTACAAGLQAIGDGVRMIRSGEADVVLAGGTEGCVDRLSIGGFSAVRALSTRNDAPQEASRPFDRDRDGFVMGEGAGLMVIETLEHARARGATPLVEVTGYGTSADAYHLTAGPEDGSGCALAIQAALRMAGLGGADIGYVNAHATSTPVGDRAEIAALRRVFGQDLPNIPVSSTKSAIGHLLGAAGGVEAIFTALALRDGILPPTLNLHQVDDGMEDLDFVPNHARKADLKHALCNGFGFGGVNASLLLSAI